MWCDYRRHYAVVTPTVNTTCVTRVGLYGSNGNIVISYAPQVCLVGLFFMLGHVSLLHYFLRTKSSASIDMKDESAFIFAYTHHSDIIGQLP